MARTAHDSGAAAGPPEEGTVGPGTVIADRYRLERSIGTGGMATIWEATHLALNRSVAVKFIEIAGRQTEKMRARFLREARVAAAVRHRNVVDILDFGTDEGRPFMVMELLVGSTLARRMGHPPALGSAETVRIMARVLSGLAAVHDAGIIHRDLKPENVFLVQDADGIYPKLLDFGVSRAIDPSGELESVLPTMENAIVGTPQYMSPEQARGLSTLDFRSDLWSAGVMLYELLTGVLPFDSEAVGDVIIQIATADPPNFAALRPDLAGPVAEVVQRAMQRDPKDRFQSAREMRAALLAAAARTAASLQRDGHAHPRDDLQTTSDMPPIDSKELLDAVGDSYEPGDSGLLELGIELEVTSSGARPVPPPPTPRERASAEAAFPPSAPKRSKRGWLVGGAIVLVAASVAGVVLSMRGGDQARDTGARRPTSTASVPAPPATEPLPAEVHVELRGLTSDARVTVDGAPATPPLVLARDGRAHAIAVSDADGRSWSTSFVASSDGAYDVVLEGEPERAIQPAPAPPRHERARRRARRVHRAEGLVRDPGF